MDAPSPRPDAMETGLEALRMRPSFARRRKVTGECSTTYEQPGGGAMGLAAGRGTSGGTLSTAASAAMDATPANKLTVLSMIANWPI